MLSPWRLRIIETLERLGTVRATAEALHVSGATVSQQLAVLEREVGVELLEKRGRGLVLTPTGRLFVERARELLDHMESVEVELTAVASEPVGVVRVGGFASAITSIVLPAVAALRTSHPLIEVEITESEPHESLVAVRQSTCDVVVTFDGASDRVVDDDGLIRAEIARDPLLLVLGSDHAGGSTLSDFAGDAWALEPADSYLGALVPRVCRSAGFEPRIAARFTSLELIVDLCARGLAVAVLPELALVGRDAAVVTRALPELGARRISTLARRPSAARPAVQVVLAALRAAAPPRRPPH